MGNSSALLGRKVEENLAQCCSGATQASSRESSFDDFRDVPAEQPREAVIIFDWDDTLMCSSEIKAHKNPDPEDMRLLEEAVENVLRTAISLGKTTIVTNANLCWVRATANIFMPSVLPVLQFIDVMSARQSYEQRWPGNPSAWKRQAFRDVVGCPSSKGEVVGMPVWFNPETSSTGTSVPSESSGGVNLVVLGDSSAEIQAGRSAVKSLGEGESIVKTVKFKELPTVRELLGQLQVVAKDLEGVVAEDRTAHKQLVHKSLVGWSLRDATGRDSPRTTTGGSSERSARGRC